MSHTSILHAPVFHLRFLMLPSSVSTRIEPYYGKKHPSQSSGSTGFQSGKLFVTLGVRADYIEQLVFETAIYSGKRFYVVVNKKMEFWSSVLLNAIGVLHWILLSLL